MKIDIGRMDAESIVDLIAEVEIMLEQLRLIFDSDAIDEAKEQKILRLNSLLSGNI